MAHELPRHEQAPARARCSACGRRVPSDDPACPEHGQVSIRANVPVADEVSSFSLRAPEGLQVDIPGYRLLRVLGRGGFGTVFEAEPEAGGAKVAIKLARHDRLDAARHLVKELTPLRAIGPPHVPLVHGWGELGDGATYLVMEYITAPTLDERMVARAMPPHEAAATAAGILDALAAVHAAGFVHGDLKPENILVDDELTARLIDFGLVIMSSGEPESSGDRGVVGTPEYMAPEQCSNQADVDARADVYAMGVILYEMIAGRPPFWGAPAVVRQAHCERRPARPSTLVPVPAPIEGVILRCLAKKPLDRFAGAAELRAAFAAALAHADSRELFRSAPPSARAPQPPVTSARERRRGVLVFFSSALDVIALRRKVTSLGGQLVHAVHGRYVAMFGHEAGEDPVRWSVLASQELIHRGVCVRAAIDTAYVTIQTRADSSRRYVSSLFSRADRFPAESDPAGVFVTPDVAALLPDVPGVRVEDERGWIRVESPQPGSPPQLDDVEPHKGPLIGRDEVLERLLSSAREAAQGKPSLVRVVAEPGHGKSHLAAVLAERLRAFDQPGTVIEVRAGESALHGNGQALRSLLVQALDLTDAAHAGAGRAQLDERLGARAASLGPILALALGWLAPSAPELAARTVAPSALDSAVKVGVAEALRLRAARAPLFVVLDDAHHADEGTLAALELATHADIGAPIWVCTLARPGFERPEPSGGARGDADIVDRLGPLDLRSAIALCRVLLRPVEDVSESAVQRLVERAQSIPLMLVELIRGLKRQGLVRRRATGGGWYLATDELEHLPSSPRIEWLAEGELDGMAPALRVHARLIALLGAGITLSEVEGVLSRLEQEGDAESLPLDASVSVARLLVSGTLVQHADATLGFRHALTGEAIAHSTPEGLRCLVHRAAYAYYGESLSIPEARRLAKLAYHASKAGLGDAAQALYVELAERARARHAYVEAEALYSRAIEQPALPLLAAYRGRGLMRYRIERYQDALHDLARARDLAAAQGDAALEAEILLDEATALDWMEQYASSSDRVQRARQLAIDASLDSPALEARLLLGSGRSLHRSCQEEDAASTMERAAAAAERLGDAEYETLVIALVMLGFIYPAIGRLTDARRVLDHAVRLCEEHGDMLHLVAAINNRALLLACLGDKAGMLADFSHQIELARVLGHRTPELCGHYNLGEYLYLMDDVEAAAPHVQRAVELERRRLGAQGRPVVALLAARVQLYRGDVPGARAAIGAIWASQVAAIREGRTDTLMMPSEEVLACMVDLMTREASDAEWDDLEAASARLSVGQEQIEVIEARALWDYRRGRLEDAHRRLRQAIELASRIPNVMGARLRRRLDEVSSMLPGTC
ncbi:serine/threonine-protein kinase [Sorangium sp. So ce124]|uniref:serine/threonine-protein kinase n=1 Tax=Sorangium sp. So ce124 TaxID=3133280 RepID=UPI003F628EDE